VEVHIQTEGVALMVVVRVEGVVVRSTVWWWRGPVVMMESGTDLMRGGEGEEKKTI